MLVPLSLLTKASLIGRDLVAAYFFGATPALDAFLVADSIPRFLGSALLVGSFSMVFVPVLVEQL
ncbi:MAG: murein biosynthesis integral membrane protein MurJ, partial [Chloroflexi bacterium]|nr:murein biosynthesis integral membrane protein MurJ [Chloroflexota bacterium]